MEDVRKLVLDSVKALDHWLDDNGWAGYDPYDVKGHHLILRISNLQSSNSAINLTKVRLLQLIERFPRTSRQVLRITKQVNAKAMGLFGAAYMNLYKQLKEADYLRKANECTEWLERNKSLGYSGACWGHPFDWHSLILIPRGTPSATMAAICGDAFWYSYQVTGEKKCLDICESICNFLIGDLNIDNVSDDRVCFSYTPLDRFHVHNANLLTTEFLLKIGKELGQRESYDLAFKALNYTLATQNDDGSFYYWALSDKSVYNIADTTLKNIDHYHTGFVLRSLYSIYELTSDARVFEALSKGYGFYRDNLFEGKMVPKLKPSSIYPIDIHSCAEAILCMSTLSDIFPDAQEYARNAFIWTKENMQDQDGHFYYRKTISRTNKMPYIRWGQAWMLKALSNLLESEQSGLQWEK